MGNLDLKRTYTDYHSRLDKLTTTLPSRFHPRLNEARDKLFKLFQDGYPTVLNHVELAENNVHADPKTGHITGVLDWLDAAPGPFGLALWGVDVVLGVSSGSGWHWHKDHVTLRQQFWDAFTTAVGGLTDEQVATIKLARVVGIFFAFTCFKGQADDVSIGCLDALLDV